MTDKRTSLAGYDMDALKEVFLKAIKKYIGRKNAITGRELLISILFFDDIDITQRQMRDLINIMRNQEIPICSESGVGYWWPATPEEVIKFVEQEIESRGKNLLKTASQVRKGIPNVFGPQLELEI